MYNEKMFWTDMRAENVWSSAVEIDRLRENGPAVCSSSLYREPFARSGV